MALYKYLINNALCGWLANNDSSCVNILHVVKHVVNYSAGQLLVCVLNILKSIKHIAWLMTKTLNGWLYVMDWLSVTDTLTGWLSWLANILCKIYHLLTGRLYFVIYICVTYMYVCVFTGLMYWMADSLP